MSNCRPAKAKRERGVAGLGDLGGMGGQAGVGIWKSHRQLSDLHPSSCFVGHCSGRQEGRRGVGEAENEAGVSRRAGQGGVHVHGRACVRVSK